MTKKQFFKSLDQMTQICTYVGVFFGFLSVGITTAFAVISNVFLLIDVAIMLACVIGIIKLKSRVASCVLLAHYVISQLTAMFSGAPTNVGVVTGFTLAYIASIYGTVKFHKEWKKYQHSIEHADPADGDGGNNRLP